jgi:DNA-binding response OmpR family regulator
MCQSIGMRFRRADCLRSARRHLATYRPSLMLIDLGLPDGSGLDLIAELRQCDGRFPVLAMSADTALRGPADEAGADGFLEKPLASLNRFRQLLRHHLAAQDGTGAAGHVSPPVPDAEGRAALRQPDPLALRDDLVRAEKILTEEPAQRGYVAEFLGGLASCTGDADLAHAAASMRRDGGDSLQKLQSKLRAHAAISQGITEWSDTADGGRNINTL